MQPGEKRETIVTFVCPNGHTWQTKAIEGGMARPLPGMEGLGAVTVTYEMDHCNQPNCHLRGMLVPE
jgi:hypothetical protein